MLVKIVKITSLSPCKSPCNGLVMHYKRECLLQGLLQGTFVCCALRATQTEMMILSHPHRPHFRSATSSDLPSFPVYPSSPATQPLTGTWSFPALQAGESFFQVAMGSWPHAIAWWSRPQFVMEGETPNRVYDLPVALAAFIVATRQPARRPRLERAEARL